MPRQLVRRHRSRPTVEPLEGRALLAALMVTNTLDSGAGSLRQAILDANGASGASTIGFAIPGSGIHTISPASSLPNIAEPVTIDGTTQPGYSGSPLIALDGASLPFVLLGVTYSDGVGLAFLPGSTGSVVDGLAVDRFDFAGIIGQVPKLTIENSDIGVDPAGVAKSGDGTGILIETNPPSLSVGATISGNTIGENTSNGIDLFPGTGVSIVGNFIGTDAKGTAGLGNGNDGILARSGTTTTTISNNTIANNGYLGIEDDSNGGLASSGNNITNNGLLIANLAVTASSSSIATTTGQAVTVTYTVTNNGPAAAGNARLDLSSQDAEPFISGSVPVTRSAVFAITGGSASQGTVSPGFLTTSEVAMLGTLASGASATVTINATIIGSGDDGINATASSGSPSDSLPASKAATSIAATGTADLAVVASASPTSVRVGQPETFTFVVTNKSQYNAPGLFALQFAPTAGVAQMGVLTSQGTVTALAGFANGYGGNLGTLAPGGSATITAVIIPPAAGTVSAALYAYSAADTDPAPANNLAYAAAATTSSPSVLGASLLPSSGSITAVSVYFDSPLNASLAQDVGNYALTTRSGARIGLRSASYDAASHVVTLRLSRASARSQAPLQLVVAGAGSPGLAGIDGAKLSNPGLRFTLS